MYRVAACTNAPFHAQTVLKEALFKGKSPVLAVQQLIKQL
jgi:hypothetical protein